MLDSLVLHDTRPWALVQDQQTYQLVDTLLAWSPRPASTILAAAKLQQHVHALENVPACNNTKRCFLRLKPK